MHIGVCLMDVQHPETSEIVKEGEEITVKRQDLFDQLIKNEFVKAKGDKAPTGKTPAAAKK